MARTEQADRSKLGDIGLLAHERARMSQQQDGPQHPGDRREANGGLRRCSHA
jgi:hypothetical protein